MAWNFSPDRPVYVQLAEMIRANIISGEYPPSAQIPSVRQLAIEIAVNPNTVQRALSELEADGLLESRGTLGRFVTSDQAVINNCRNESARRLVAQFICDARRISITDEKLIELVKEELYECT